MLLSLQDTIRSVPPSPNFGDLCEKHWHCNHLEISLAQTMIVLPVRPHPASLWAVSGSKMQYRSVVSDSCLQGNNTGQLGTTLFRMHATACAAYLATILISALLMPTLLAASTPCFLSLWLTSPFAEYPSSLPQGTPAV